MRDVSYIQNENWQVLRHKNYELGKGKFIHKAYSQRGILKRSYQMGYEDEEMIIDVDPRQEDVCNE